MRRVLAGLVLGMVAMACGGGAPESTKYKQTWSQPYDKTDCEEWSSDMDDHQRFVMAADLLLTLQRKDKADVPIPSDDLIGKFEAALDAMCDDTDAIIADEDRNLLDMAPIAYLAEDTFRPS